MPVFRTLFPPDRDELYVEMIREAGVNAVATSTVLTMEEFAALCYAYQKIVTREDPLLHYDYRAKENLPAWRSRHRKMFI